MANMRELSLMATQTAYQDINEAVAPDGWTIRTRQKGI